MTTLKEIIEAIFWYALAAAIWGAVFGFAAWVFWAGNPQLFGRHSARDNPDYAGAHEFACGEVP